MIDDTDPSESMIPMLVSQALKEWNSPALLKLIFNEECIVRTAAARHLQIRGEEETFHKVTKHVADSRPYVREICAFILGQLGTPARPFKEESYPILLNMLDDVDAEVRTAAACSLAHLFSHDMPEHVESKLIAMVEDSSEDVRECVGFALGKSSGSEEAVAALKRLQDDSNEDVASWAELGLELLEDAGLLKKQE